MSIKSALVFIERGRKDPELRKKLNASSGPGDTKRVLSMEGIDFSDFEFEEAFNHRLVQCREFEEADELQEFRMWWELLNNSTGSPGCHGCRGTKAPFI